MESLEQVDFKNIVVRMPNWIGDLVMATPILTDLRKQYPHARITAMCRKPICELLREDPDIDELFCFTKVPWYSRHSDLRNLTRKLRQGKYDLGVLLTNSFSSAWWFWQGRVKVSLGYADHMRRLLLTHPIKRRKEKEHLVDTYKRLLMPLGIPLSQTPPRLFLQAGEVEEARELLANQGVERGAHIVGINPGATYGSAKCWLPERFREVAKRLLEDPKNVVVFFGDLSTAPLAKDICQGLGPRVINLTGKTTLRLLAALISLCDVLLTNDSGPMHIADALGTSLVALFGSTDEQVTGPYKSGAVIHKHVSCSPCLKRTCPIDFRCMKQITVDEVLKAIAKC